MEEIKISLTEEGKDLINKYSKLKNISQKEFIKQAIIEKIEDEEDLDEQELLKEIENTKTDKKYTHEEVWKILGI